jgi:phage-related protein
MTQQKELRWIGSSKEDLLAFPKETRKEAGFQLSKIQAGLEPDDWKSLDNIGSGIKEIRIRDNTGNYRIIYIAKLEDAIYVLHCFQKKDDKITSHHRDIIKTRYQAVKKQNN